MNRSEMKINVQIETKTKKDQKDKATLIEISAGTHTDTEMKDRK